MDPRLELIKTLTELVRELDGNADEMTFAQIDSHSNAEWALKMAREVVAQPRIPEGWTAIPESQFEYLQRKVDFLEALEAAGLDSQGDLIEMALEIMKQWEGEQGEDS